MSTEVHQGIARADAVLTTIVSAPGQSMKASDIARAIGLGPSTTGRLLASLEELGYVSKEHATGTFTIGTRFLDIASRGLNQISLHREGRPLAQELAQATGLSANLGMRDDNYVSYLCHFEGTKARKSHTMVGMRQPLHASALGKCLLMDHSKSSLQEIMPENLEKYTAYTLGSVADLLQDLSLAHERGYCVEDQELALGRYGIAAPIRDAHAHIIGAISLSGRKSTFADEDIDRLSSLTLEVADRISVGLGYLSAIPDPTI